MPKKTFPEVDFSVSAHAMQFIDFTRGFLSLVPMLTNTTEQSFIGADSDTYGDDEWHSYRKFPVFAGGFVYNGSTFRSRVFQTGNVKREPKQKVCAEKRLLGSARKGGYLALAGLFVRATSDEELIAGVSGRPRVTLPPCDDCSKMFDDHPLVSPDLPIITMGYPGEAYQVCTPAELRDFYAGKPMTTEFETVIPDLGGWEHRIASYDRWNQDVTLNGLSKVITRSRLATAAMRVPQDQILDFARIDGWRDRPELAIAA